MSELSLVDPLLLLIIGIIVAGLFLYIIAIWLPKKMIKLVAKLVIAAVVIIWVYVSFLM